MINNKVLALKYRPQEFKDLIGQEVIAQTITNAIKINKTPNAYLLTGIRGVGKTTTARLIAKALNCLKNQDKNQKCSPQNFCSSCNAFGRFFNDFSVSIVLFLSKRFWLQFWMIFGTKNC